MKLTDEQIKDMQEAIKNYADGKTANFSNKQFIQWLKASLDSESFYKARCEELEQENERLNKEIEDGLHSYQMLQMEMGKLEQENERLKRIYSVPYQDWKQLEQENERLKKDILLWKTTAFEVGQHLGQAVEVIEKLSKTNADNSKEIREWKSTQTDPDVQDIDWYNYIANRFLNQLKERESDEI